MKRLLFPLLLITSILLSGSIATGALMQGWTPPEDYRANESIGSVFHSSEDDKRIEAETDEMSIEEEIFGSEQVFPFSPGLGK